MWRLLISSIGLSLAAAGRWNHTSTGAAAASTNSRPAANNDTLIVGTADGKERFVANPINRYCVGNQSGLATNADGSVDIYIQKAAPAGHESNWLPAPGRVQTPAARVHAQRGRLLAIISKGTNDHKESGNAPFVYSR